MPRRNWTILQLSIERKQKSNEIRLERYTIYLATEVDDNSCFHCAILVQIVP